MKISNVKIYDMYESIVASGLPMTVGFDENKFEEDVKETYLSSLVDSAPTEKGTKNLQRAVMLAKNAVGTGHNNFLSGILVSANITATVKWWEQFQRYHFKQIVSSQSSMHRIESMLKRYSETKDRDSMFHPSVDQNQIDALVNAFNEGNKTIEELAYSCPMGLLLTARITTNYLQLKTMYNQRKNHKLKEWHDFCAWAESLPFAKEFIV